MSVKSLLHKPLRFYLQGCAGILAIILGLVFFFVDRAMMGTDIHFNDFSHITMIFMIAGGLVSLIDAFFPLPFVGIVSSVLYGCGIGAHMFIACYPMADLVAPVAFFTNDINKAKAVVPVFVVFLVLFALIAIASIVANFLSAKKKEA